MLFRKLLAATHWIRDGVQRFIFYFISIYKIPVMFTYNFLEIHFWSGLLKQTSERLKKCRNFFCEKEKKC